MKPTAANIVGVSCFMFMVAIAVIVSLSSQHEHGYSKKDIQLHKAIQEKAEREWLERNKAPLHVRQQQALYEVWNLTEADVAKPVDLWGTK